MKLSFKNSFQILLVIMLFLTYPLFSHQDVEISNSYKKIHYKIQTSFRHEERVKLEMVVRLIDQLAEELNYYDSIYINYHHQYIGHFEPDYGLSFDQGEVFVSDDEKDSIYLYQKDVLVIKIYAYTLNPLQILKLADFGMRNIPLIQSTQTINQTSKWLINYRYSSIPQLKIDSILSYNESSFVKKIDSQKNLIEHNKFPNNYYDDINIYYYYQSGLYHLSRKPDIYTGGVAKDKDSLLISLSNIYQFEMLDCNQCMVFDTDCSFYFLDVYKYGLSPKMIIKFDDVNEKKWLYSEVPKPINYLDGDLVSIYLGSYSPPTNNVFDRKVFERHVLYNIKEKKLIQNLEELILQKK
jgi:hypothetical protein